MNKYFSIALVALCAGCVHTTHIISVKIAKTNDKEITLSVVTNEDVLKYDNSHWAYKVHLVYSVNDNKFFSNIGTDTKIDGTPFLAKRVSTKSIPH